MGHKRDGVILSPKHGLNPSVRQCFYCGGDADIALFGKLTRTKAAKIFGKEVAKTLEGEDGDVKAPRLMGSTDPCNECLGHMKEGIILIEVDPAKTTSETNPWRTGNVAVVKESFIYKAVKDEKMQELIRNRRFAFLEQEVWSSLQLPGKLETGT